MRILSIVHQEDAGPGVFAQALRDEHVPLDSWLLPSQERPPRPLGDYAGVLTLGGAMHPDQEREHPWMADEKAVLGELVERGVPLLGVCLGAELLAAAMGATVWRAAEPEVGWYEVRASPDGLCDPLIGPLGAGFKALEWHSYECSLPPGAMELARSERCLQAFRVGEAAWGIQFHAEVTGEDFETWLDDYRSDRDALEIGLDPEALRTSSRRAMPAWNDFGRQLCGRFLGVARTACGVGAD
jgi:GMP synthase-like glutamine amidotransferase